MAVKPSITFVDRIRAQDTNYSTGPVALIGTPTKIAPPGFAAPSAQLQEGWKADQKPPGQWENWADNRVDLWGAWVEQGSTSKLQEAHIKEADALGQVSCAAINAGDTSSALSGILVRPNSDGDGRTGILGEAKYGQPAGIFESDDAGVSALVVESPAGVTGNSSDPGVLRVNTGLQGPPALHIQAENLGPLIWAMDIVQTGDGAGAARMVGGNADPGAALNGAPTLYVQGGADSGAYDGGPAARFFGNASGGDGNVVEIGHFSGSVTGAGLRIDTEAFMTGIQVVDGSGQDTCVRLQSFDGGANRSAPIVLVPQAFSLAGSAVEEGAFWVQTGAFDSGTQYTPRFYGQASNYLQWSRAPFCALDIENNTTVTGGVDDNWFAVISSVEFPNPLIPISSGWVVVALDLAVQRTSNTSTILANSGSRVRVIDVTNANDVIFEDTIDLAPNQSGTDENRLRTYYSTTFGYELPAAGQREFRVEARRDSPASSGSITVLDIKFRIRSRP